MRQYTQCPVVGGHGVRQYTVLGGDGLRRYTQCPVVDGHCLRSTHSVLWWVVMV